MKLHYQDELKGVAQVFKDAYDAAISLQIRKNNMDRNSPLKGHFPEEFFESYLAREFPDLVLSESVKGPTIACGKEFWLGGKKTYDGYTFDRTYQASAIGWTAQIVFNVYNWSGAAYGGKNITLKEVHIRKPV